ncbi:hypothetical protein GCM10027343_43770 [Noviherbaspirillum agri]
MLKKILFAAACGMVSVSTFAVDASQVQKSIELKDGSTVHVFKDGKMGMEDKYGRAVRMKEGQIMETKDGQKIAMVGDEVARLDLILYPEYRGGSN